MKAWRRSFSESGAITGLGPAPLLHLWDVVEGTADLDITSGGLVPDFWRVQVSWDFGEWVFYEDVLPVVGVSVVDTAGHDGQALWCRVQGYWTGGTPATVAQESNVITVPEA